MAYRVGCPFLVVPDHLLDGVTRCLIELVTCGTRRAGDVGAEGACPWALSQRIIRTPARTYARGGAAE